MASAEQTSPRVHPLALVAGVVGGVLLVLMVIGIGVLIVILKGSRDHIRAQDAKTAVLLEKVRAATPEARELPPLLDDVRPLVRSLGAAIGPIAESAQAIAAATPGIPRLVDAAQVLDQVRAYDLVRISAQAGRDTPPLIRRLLRVQLATLTAQRIAVRTQLQTLAVQREALTHIKSIDRKTGGTVPAQRPPVPAP
ncbi:MAG TPA: hypothetical protein VF545_07190 [Thermoleophilaceae bacterium]|jgi:hypothetical protein